MSNYPFELGPAGSTLPMSGNPYWSRVSLFQIQNPTTKNYSFIAFKPGLPLQASELNELQENNAMSETLTHAMRSLWPTYLPSYSNGNPIYGPGWNGTTPLYPKFDDDNFTENMVGYTGSTISIREGWYLVTVPSSGLKHWVYLDVGFTTSIPDVDPGEIQYLGFTTYYETIKPTQDPSLYDNSTGMNIVTGAAAGADRIKVNILAPFWTTNKNSQNFSPIAKKIDNGEPILYMNNVPVPEE